MKRFAIIVIMLGFGLIPAFLSQFVESQSLGNAVSTTTSMPTCTATTVVMPVLNVTGGTLVMYSSNSSHTFGPAINTITDTNSITWHKMNAPSSVTCALDQRTEIWYATGEPTGNDTITVGTLGGSSGICSFNFQVQDFTGMGSVTQDAYSLNGTGNSTSPALNSAFTGPATPPDALALAANGFSTNTNTRTGGPTNSFTELTDMLADSTLYPAYKFFPSINQAVGWTATNSDCWVATLNFLDFSPSPTPSATATPTASPTPTPTPTPTTSVTPTPTLSPTPSPSVTPTISVTPTLSATPTVTATISPTPCPACIVPTPVAATSWWPIIETSGTTITDTIDSNSGTISGSYTLTGNGVSCTTGTGSGCNIVTPVKYTSPQPFSFYFQFSGTQGGMFQLGSTSSQQAAQTFYVGFLDNYGRVTVGVNNYGLTKVLQSPLSYADGNIHSGLVSVGARGMKLYVDGKLVASRNVQLANYTAGYWFFGGINGAGWQYSPSSPYFMGTLYTFGWWNGLQITDAQAEAQTGTNIPPITNNYAQITGDIASVAQDMGYAYAFQDVTFTTFGTQLTSCSTVPISPSQHTYKTDGAGNLPACLLLQQGARMLMSIGDGPPIPITVPCQCSVPLYQMLLSPTPTVTATSNIPKTPTPTPLIPTPTPTPTLTTTATPSSTPTPPPAGLPCNAGAFQGQYVTFTIPTCGGSGTSANMNVRAGDSLFVATGYSGTGASTISTITDSQGDTWTLNDVAHPGGSNQAGAIGHVFSAVGGPTTVTVTISGGSSNCNTNVYFIETPLATAKDVTAFNDSGSLAGKIDSGTTTITAQNNEFVLAVGGENGSAVTAGPSNGFNEFVDPSNNDSVAACIETTTTGTQNTQWLVNNFAPAYAAVIGAYKLSGGTPTATPTPSPTPTPTATPTPALVQQAGLAASGVTSASPAFAVNATVGHTVALFYNANVPATLPTLTISGLGATWVKLGCFLATAGNPATCIYAGVVATPGTAISVSGLSNYAETLTIAEFSSMPGTIMQDGTFTTGSGAHPTTIQPNAYVNNAPPDLILCTAGQIAFAFPTNPGSPWHNLAPQNTGSFSITGQGTYQVVTSGSSFQPSWGASIGNWAAMCTGLQWVP